MLRYKETYWKYKTGFKTRNFDLAIDTIDPSKNTEEQNTRIEKISLVAFLSGDQKKALFSVGRCIKKNNSDFYQNSNLHVTLFGFGPLEKKQYQRIQEKIRVFNRRERGKELTIKFDAVRPGAFYLGKNGFRPINGWATVLLLLLATLMKILIFVIIQTD